MAYPAQIHSYQNNYYEGMSPEQLILMLFKGALDRLKLVRQGIEENNIQKRGENLSKVIAIVSELNASLDSKMTDESTQFLQNLYTAILTELPKVSIDNNIQIVDQTERYLEKLTHIWETDVMGKETPKETQTKTASAPKAVPANKSVHVNKSVPANGYYPGPGTPRLGSISV
jgi:flagellar secretion chaperone FliS